MANRTLLFAFCSFSSLVAGCADYAVTVNQQPVYSPSPAVQVDGLADENLARCIEQTLIDQNASALTALTRLVCTSAGIEDLTGIEQLEGLTELDLDSNSLERVTPLQMLRQLSWVRLSNNPDLSCSDLAQLADLRGDGLTVLAPIHCAE